MVVRELAAWKALAPVARKDSSMSGYHGTRRPPSIGPPNTPRTEEETRRILALCAVLLLVLDLCIFLVTRDQSIVTPTALIGVVACLVFRYYFNKK